MNSVDPDQPASLAGKLIRIYNVFDAVFTKLHDLVDVRATYIHLLKIASDGNSYLLLGKENYGIAFSMLASANFSSFATDLAISLKSHL